MPSTDHADVISGGLPVAASWIEVPVVYSNGMVLGQVLDCVIGDKDLHPDDRAPFTLAGEVFERGKHKDLIRVFLPFGSDSSGRATGVLEVGYHRTDQRRPDWGQVEALRAAAGQPAVAGRIARPFGEGKRPPRQRPLLAHRGEAIASPVR